MNGKQIFISYGRQPEKYVKVVLRIKKDLEKDGHKVWLDTENLYTKSNWELLLEEALQTNDEVLYLMTHHATRRPDGYCLNEISYALQHNKQIVPVMIELITPPLSICRLQWLDMLDIWDADGTLSESKYKNRLQELLEVLNNKKELGVEGGYHPLTKLLAPQNFDYDIVKHTQNFIGREWIFEHIKNWMEDDTSSRVLWITGEAGFGKSAIAANVTYKIHNVAGIFFCQYDSALRKDPLELIKTFAYHLSTQLLDYKSIINEFSQSELNNPSNSVKDLFQKLLIEPLNKIQEPIENYLYVIDALDEIMEDEWGILHLIENEFDKLPSWMKVLITSRPEPELKRKLSRLEPLIFDSKDTENLNDIREYLLSHTAGLNDDALKVILDKSEGNMLYVKEVTEEIRKGRLSIDSIEEFPQGLSGVYSNYFERQFSDKNSYKQYQRPLFELMVTARESLPLDLIMDIMGWDDYELEDALEPAGSLIEIKNGKVEFFHKSISDWLIDREKCSRDFRVSEKIGKIKLAKFLWGNFKDSDYDFFNVGKYSVQIYLLLPRLLSELDSDVSLNELIIKYLHSLKNNFTYQSDILYSFSKKDAIELAKSMFKWLSDNRKIFILELEDINNIVANSRWLRIHAYELTNMLKINYQLQDINIDSLNYIDMDSTEYQKLYTKVLKELAKYRYIGTNKFLILYSIEELLFEAFYDGRIADMNGAMSMLVNYLEEEYAHNIAEIITITDRISEKLIKNGNWDNWAEKVQSIPNIIQSNG